MIDPKTYFETYLSFQSSESSLKTAKKSYRPYSALDLESIQAEAEAENPGALEELGERYLFGLNDLKVDPKKAQALFEKAADLGHPDAMHMLAEIHRSAEYDCFDYDQYFPLLQKAAEGGSWKAMFNLSCAYYKGREAYDGCGFDADHKLSLHWSTRCGFLTMGILNFYFTHNCTEEFSDYMQGVYALFVQSICVSARQLIRGDGVEKNLNMAKKMLTDAQNFYRYYFKAGCSDFDALLKYCEE